MGFFSNLFGHKEKKTSTEVLYRYISDEDLLADRKPDFCFQVAGTFIKERQDNIKKPSFSARGNRKKLYLKPEPDNEYDPNAVAVISSKTGMIGYVPASLALDVKNFMQDYPNYALLYRKDDDRPWDDSCEDFIVKVNLYALDYSTIAIEKERAAEDSCGFNEEETSFISSIKALVPDITLSAIREKDYIKLQVASVPVIKVKIGKRIKYALIPENTENLNALGMELTSASKAESGYLRALIATLDDVPTLQPFLASQQPHIKLRIAQLDHLADETKKCK